MSVFYTLSVIHRRDSRLNLDFDQPLRLFATQPFEEKSAATSTIGTSSHSQTYLPFGLSCTFPPESDIWQRAFRHGLADI